MSNQRKPFMPVTPDIDDAELERLAAGKGVGALVKPADQQPIAGEGASRIPAASAPASGKPAATHPPSGATPRGRMRPLNLELPDYVLLDLKIRAAHANTSVRHLVMRALQANGIFISDADMVEDGRRLRN